MKTVYNSLTFYDSVDKQDYNRTKAQIPVFSARHYLPPFLIDLDTDIVATSDSITVALIDKDGNAYGDPIAGITGWTNLTMDALTSSGLNITGASALNTQLARSNIFAMQEGDTITLTCTFNVTLYSGTITMDVYTSSSVETLVLSPGVNTITHTYGSGASTSYIVLTASGAPPTGLQFTLTNVSTSLTRPDINRYFTALPEVIISSSLGNYIQYKGDILNYLLPLGLYYVKVSVAGYEYVSDYIMVDNIYDNLITAWTNSGYESLTSIGTTITSAINTSGSGSVNSNSFLVKKGENLTIIFFLTLNSGTPPLVQLGGYGTFATATSGINVLSATAVTTSLSTITFENASTNGNWSVSGVIVIRGYSSRFCKLRFTDTNNLGNLLYEDDFAQVVHLEATLNNPTHENTIVGEEKDGIFIPEKIVSKQVNTLIAYVSRAIYNALIRLPQHDTITITDETGNVYSPAAGNVTIEQPEWTYYDTCKMTIRFGDGDNTAYTWTK